MLSDKYEKLLELENYFVNLEEISDTILKKQCESILKRGRNLCFCCLGFGFAVLTLWIIVPFFKNGSLPYTSYIPEGMFIEVALIQTISIIFVVIVLFGHDFLINNMLFQTCVQFRILRYKFTELDFRGAHKNKYLFHRKLVNLIDHHNFLLKYYKIVELLNLFSTFFYISDS